MGIGKQQQENNLHEWTEQGKACRESGMTVGAWCEKNSINQALYWEGNGFVLLYKRLERGSFQWPRTAEELRDLSPQQFRWLMEGLSIDQPKAHKPVSGISMA